MSEMEPAELLRDLSERLEQVSSVLNPAKLEAEVSELEQQAAEPGLWDDQEKAQKITSSLSHKKLTLSRLRDLASGVDDARVLLELSSQEADGTCDCRWLAEEQLSIFGKKPMPKSTKGAQIFRAIQNKIP